MKTIAYSFVLTVGLWGAVPAHAAEIDRVELAPSNVAFVQNHGQLEHPEIRYYVRYPQVEVGFAEGRILFNVLTWGRPGDDDGGTARHVGGAVFALDVGDGTVEPRARERHASYSNYFLDSDPARWRSRVPHFGSIVYPDVYPDIDLAYRIDPGGALKYEYVVNPGADPTAIVMRYRALVSSTVDADGKLELMTAAGSLFDAAPVCHQPHGAGTMNVDCGFAAVGIDSYGVDVGPGYDPARVLIVDPTITIAFSTYWGDGGATNRTVVLDSGGNIYMSGGTSSTTWPTTMGAYDTMHSGTQWPDVTSAKFDPDGNVLWSTFIGGPSEDYAYVSAVNDAGELFVSGRSGTGFPTTAGAFDETFNGGIQQGNVHDPTDIFVTRLAPDGDALIYSTYIGGSGNENGRAIHLLANNELIVGGGNTTSQNLPTTGGVLKPSRGGAKDGYVLQVAADGSNLTFCTYFGPNNDNDTGDETIRGLGVDSSGNIWIGGTTQGSDMTPTQDAFQQSRGSASEGFIAKIDSDATDLVYFSWLGGNGNDEIETEGVSDPAGNFFVAGSTASSDFPVTPNAFQDTLLGGGAGGFDGDGWVARINDDGTLELATYYGGTTVGPEAFFGPVVDADGNVYCNGRFRSPDCATTPDAFQSTKAGPDNEQDAVLAVFSPDGTELLYGSFFGGDGVDHGRHIGIHPDGSAVVLIAESNSQNIPLVDEMQSTPAGAWLAKFDIEADGTSGTTTGADTTGDSGSADASATGDTTGGSASASASAGDGPTSADSTSATESGAETGDGGASDSGGDGCGCVATRGGGRLALALIIPVLVRRRRR